MTDKMFSSGSLEHLKRGLDAYALRQRVIAENIAQAETPGFKSRSVEFEALLRRAGGNAGASGLSMRTGSARHMPVQEGPLPAARIADESTRAMDNGVNDVSMDMEMAALAENSLKYKLASRILAARYQKLKSAIRGRS